MLNKFRSQLYWGSTLLKDEKFLSGAELNITENEKRPYRYELRNFLLSKTKDCASYVEIGTRNPEDNFNKINCEKKYSVDPGIEFFENPVDFKMTSDQFFEAIRRNEILSNKIKFDVIFIDGLHLANQAYKDILNSLDFVKDDGFIVVHDCNPPTEYHAREDHNFRLSPAKNNWNGTVWKAFYKARFIEGISCCCIDSDWGVGVITKRNLAQPLTNNFNPFFEYHIFSQNRKESLNLMNFEAFKSILNG